MLIEELLPRNLLYYSSNFFCKFKQLLGGDYFKQRDAQMTDFVDTTYSYVVLNLVGFVKIFEATMCLITF